MTEPGALPPVTINDLPRLADDLLRAQPEAVWDLAGPLTAALSAGCRRRAANPSLSLYQAPAAGRRMPPAGALPRSGEDSHAR